MLTSYVDEQMSSKECHPHKSVVIALLGGNLLRRMECVEVDHAHDELDQFDEKEYRIEV